MWQSNIRVLLSAGPYVVSSRRPCICVLATVLFIPQGLLSEINLNVEPTLSQLKAFKSSLLSEMFVAEVGGQLICDFHD